MILMGVIQKDKEEKDKKELVQIKQVLKRVIHLPQQVLDSHMVHQGLLQREV